MATTEAAEIRFYRATGQYAWLSNLYPAPVHFEQRIYPDAERAYQFGKPRECAVAEWLIAAPSASLCAQAAHGLFPWQVCEGWADKKVPRMRAVLSRKFRQNKSLGSALLLTGDAALIEDSKTDAFWGTGKKGTGKNMLGVLLMELREQLRREERHG